MYVFAYVGNEPTDCSLLKKSPEILLAQLFVASLYRSAFSSPRTSPSSAGSHPTSSASTTSNSRITSRVFVPGHAERSAGTSTVRASSNAAEYFAGRPDLRACRGIARRPGLRVNRYNGTPSARILSSDSPAATRAAVCCFHASRNSYSRLDCSALASASILRHAAKNSGLIVGCLGSTPRTLSGIALSRQHHGNG